MVTDELVDKALEVVARGGGNYEYFFSKLNSPDWIGPLQKRGRFSHPPPAVIEKTSILFPGWPEGEYLVRMASVAPEAVFEAIDAECFESDNHSVHQILLRIAAELPVELAARMVFAEAKWRSQQKQFYVFSADNIVAVILKLAAGGRADAALALLDPEVQVEAASEQTDIPESLTDSHPRRGSGTLVSRIDSWNIQRLLLQVSKALVEAAPEKFLELISQRLDTAVAIYVNERGDGTDFSLIWRPRVDSGRFGDLLDTLVSGVRDAAVHIAQAGGYETVLRVFENYRWPIFQRLKYYALSHADNLPDDLVVGLVSQQALYEDQRANPEFNDLLSEIAPSLPEGTRDKLLSLVDAGPDLSRYSNFLIGQGDKREESERWLADQWRLGWLTVLKGVAGDERVKQLEQLLARYGPPRPAYSISSGHAVGHLSAISLEDLKKFSIPDLIEYLKAWTPPPRNRPDLPSRAGIAQQVAAWVSEDPALFSDNLVSFQLLELHPTYLRSILDAFIGVLKSERNFDPYKVAATITWILTNTSRMDSEPYRWEEDPGWSWAHMSSAHFLSELFLHPDRLDTSRQMEFWPPLELIAGNPSPTEEDEAEYRKKADSGMLALNSARPIGLEAVMYYARWLKLSATELEVDAQTLPQVFNLLAAHLDPNVDSSVAVREMYGMQFGLLAWFDPGWWGRQLPRLFPEGGKLRHLDRFAWSSYLCFSRPIAAMWPALRFRYERAIKALQRNAAEVSDELRSLGNHLMHYYAWGVIQLEDALLTQFFAHASPALKAQTIGDIGWRLGQEGTGDLDPKIQKRLMELWEHRLAEGMEHVHASRRELASFGWWFASKKFSDEWSIHQLLSVVETFRNVTPDFAVVERLAELATTYPYEAVRILGVIFEEDRDGWAIHGWGEHPRTIINEALKADEHSRAEADRVVNVLVARGHRGFRDFLREGWR